MTLLITTEEELYSVIYKVLVDFEKDKLKNQPEKLYSINRVAKMLGKAHATIKKMVENGTIRSTKDSLIPQSSIDAYLSRK